MAINVTIMAEEAQNLANIMLHKFNWTVPGRPIQGLVGWIVHLIMNHY